MTSAEQLKKIISDAKANGHRSVIIFDSIPQNAVALMGDGYTVEKKGGYVVVKW